MIKSTLERLAEGSSEPQLHDELGNPEPMNEESESWAPWTAVGSDDDEEFEEDDDDDEFLEDDEEEFDEDYDDDDDDFDIDDED